MMLPNLVNFTNWVKICCLIWRIPAKLSYFVRTLLDSQENCVAIFALFFETFLPKYKIYLKIKEYCLIKRYRLI